MKITVDSESNILSYAILGGLGKDQIEISESILPKGFYENFRPRYYRYNPKEQIKISENPNYQPPNMGGSLDVKSPIDILEEQLDLVSSNVGTLTKNIAIQSANLAVSQKQLQQAQKTIEMQNALINTLLQMQGNTTAGLAQVAKTVSDIKNQGGEV